MKRRQNRCHSILSLGTPRKFIILRNLTEFFRPALSPLTEQVALMGFSNESFMLFTEPTLTAVDQYKMRMGDAYPRKIVLKPELSVRQSSIRKKS
jgi:DNA-binding LacI/PurR family transcriptional regulator